MARAETTVKVLAETHQALVAVLKYIGKEIDEATFRAILKSQGRPENPTEKMLVFTAQSLLLEVK